MRLARESSKFLPRTTTAALLVLFHCAGPTES